MWRSRALSTSTFVLSDSVPLCHLSCVNLHVIGPIMHCQTVSMLTVPVGNIRSSTSDSAIVCCSPRVDKKLMFLTAIFYMLFGGCKSLIWGLPTSVGHIFLPQDRHCEPNCFHLHIFCFFSSPFSSRANRP